MGAVEKLLEHIAVTRFEDLPSDVVETAKRFILDSIGVTIAGAGAPGCEEIVQLVREWGGKPESTIMSHGGKVPAPWAAMANSTMMHALDFDDTLDESALHAHVSVLPAAMACAEAAGPVSGRSFINAVVLGVDTLCRLGISTRRPLSWIRTSTCGSFGAAVAAAKTLELNEKKLLHALGVVYSQTSGNAQCLIDGALVKRMQPAFAAKAGVVSAFMSARGITGSRDFLEGQYGFFNLYEGGDYDGRRLLDRLGDRYEGMSLSMKPYPSCRMTHGSIDAALALKREYAIDAGSVEGIVVHVSEMSHNMVGMPFEIRTDAQVDAQFSIPYTVSVAMLHGDVSLEDFRDSAIRDKSVKEFSKRITVLADPSLPVRDMSRATVEVRCGSDFYRKTIDGLKGSPANPMSLDECIRKSI